MSCGIYNFLIPVLAYVASVQAAIGKLTENQNKPIILNVLTGFFPKQTSLRLCFVYSGEPKPSQVPKVSSCHVIQEGTLSGFIKSHDGYPDRPYTPGYRCRFVISVPNGDVEVGVDLGDQQRRRSPVGLRPWDYVVAVDGGRYSELKFMCDLEKYKALGKSKSTSDHFIQKQLIRAEN